MGEYDANLEADPVNDLWGQKAWWLETNRAPQPPPPGPGAPADPAYGSAAAAAAVAYSSASSSGLAPVYGAHGPAGLVPSATGPLGPIAPARPVPAAAISYREAPPPPYGHLGGGLVGGAHKLVGLVGAEKLPYEPGMAAAGQPGGGEMMRTSYERSRMPHFGEIQARALSQGLSPGLSSGLAQGLGPQAFGPGLNPQTLSPQSQPLRLGREKAPPPLGAAAAAAAAAAVASFPATGALGYDRPGAIQQSGPIQGQQHPFSSPVGLPPDKGLRFGGEKLMSGHYPPSSAAGAGAHAPTSPVFAPLKHEGGLATAAAAAAAAAAHFVPDKLGPTLNGVATAPATSPAAVAAAAAAAAATAAATAATTVAAAPQDGLPTAAAEEKKHKLPVHERPGKKVTSRRRAKTGNPKRGLHYCKLCEYSASTKGNLTRHVRVIHERLKPFPCNQCSHKSSTSQNLETHTMKVHAQFFCDKCVEYFPTKEEYKRHKFVVHSQTTSKPIPPPRRT